MTEYKITASSRIGGIENRGWCLDWKGDGWNEPWSDDDRKDSEYLESLEDAKSIVDSYQDEFNEFVTLSVDRTTYDEDGEIVEEESGVYEIKGTKEIE